MCFAHRCVHFSTSQNAKSIKKRSEPEVLSTFWFPNLLRRYNGVHFLISSLPRWLRTGRFSEPIFRPSGAQHIGKTQRFATFLHFLFTCIYFLLTLSLLWSCFFFLFSSPTLPTPAFPSVHIVRSLTFILNFLCKSATFLWSYALCFCRDNVPTKSQIFLQNTPCPLGLSKGAVSLFWKANAYA